MEPGGCAILHGLLALVFISLFHHCVSYELPPNDQCRTAKFIDFYSPEITQIITNGSNINANFDLPEVSCSLGEIVIDYDVWYYFYSGEHTTVTISTGYNGGKTNFNTVILLLTEAGCSSTANCVAVNDNANTTNSGLDLLYASLIYYQRIEKNSKYYIVVAGNTDSGVQSTGIFELSVKFETTPHNDECTEAEPIDVLSGGMLVEGILQFGSNSVVPQCQSGSFSGTNVWYTFISYDLNYVIISSCFGSAYSDAPIELSLLTFSGVEPCAGTVNCVYDNDSCDVGSTLGNSGEIRSFLVFRLQYYILVGSSLGSESANFGIYVEFSARFEENDNCGDAIRLTTGEQVENRITYWTFDGVDPLTTCTGTLLSGGNIWYKFFSGDKSLVTLDFCDQGYAEFPVLIYFTNDAISCSSCLAAYSISCTYMPGFTMNLFPSTDYLFSVGTLDPLFNFGYAFSFKFDLSSVPDGYETCGMGYLGDSEILIAAAVEFPITAAYDVGYSYLTCMEAQVTSPLLWFSFLTASNHVFTKVETMGSTMVTKLFFFDQCQPTSCLISNAALASSESSVQLRVNPNTMYYIAVGTIAGSSGFFTLKIESQSTIPCPNDNCRDAEVVTAPGTIIYREFVFATKDEIMGYTECNIPYPTTAYNNIWYIIENQNFNSIDVNLCLGDPDITTPIFTLYIVENNSSPCSSATCIANIDNCAIVDQEIIPFRTYLLSVGGVSPPTPSGTGTIQFTFKDGSPSNDFCIDAVDITPFAKPMLIEGKITAATEPSPLTNCSPQGPSVWYKFINNWDYLSMVASTCPEFGGYSSGMVFLDVINSIDCGSLDTSACTQLPIECPGTTINFSPGAEYLFAVTAAVSTTFKLFFNFAASTTPANDICSSPGLLFGNSGAIYGTLDSVSIDDILLEYNVWYLLPLSEYRNLIISTCTPNLPTYTPPGITVSVFTYNYNSTCNNVATLVASDSDGCPGRTPHIEVEIFPYVYYYVAVGGPSPPSPAGPFQIYYELQNAGPPDNDECNNAVRLTSGTYTFIASTVSARELPPWDCQNYVTISVWYYFNSEGNNFISLQIVETTFTTRVVVFQGSCYGLRVCMEEISSYRMAAIEKYQTYFMTIGGENTGTCYVDFSLQFDVALEVGNDLCTSASVLSTQTGVGINVGGSIAGATFDAPSACAPNPLTATVWYRFNSEENNLFSIGTCKEPPTFQSFPGELYIYKGNTCDSLTCVSNSALYPYDGASCAQVEIRIDTFSNYWVAVSGPPELGAFNFLYTMNFESTPAIDSCTILLPNLDPNVDPTHTDSFGIAMFNPPLLAPGASDCVDERGTPTSTLWYNVVASDNRFAISCTNLQAPTFLSFQLYLTQSGDCNNRDLYCVASGTTDACNIDVESLLSYSMLPGVSYLLSVRAYEFFSGEFSITMSSTPPEVHPNSYCIGAQALQGPRGDLFVYTPASSLTPISVPACQNVDAFSSYYFYTIDAGTQYNRLTVSVCDPTFPAITSVAFWMGEKNCELFECEQITLDTSSQCFAKAATVKVLPNTQYIFVVFLPKQVKAHITYELTVSPPSNDLCEFALDLNGIGFGDTNSTVGAMSEFGGCAEVTVDSPALWYRVDIRNANTMVLFVNGPSDTVVGIYEGPCNNLACYSTGDDFTSLLNPTMEVMVNRDTTYYLSIANYNRNENAGFSLLYVPSSTSSPSADDCEIPLPLTLEAFYLTLELDTRGATSDHFGEIRECSGKEIYTNVWYSFNAGSFNWFEMTLCGFDTESRPFAFSNFPLWIQLFKNFEEDCSNLRCAGTTEPACGSFGEGGYVKAPIVQNQNYVITIGGLYHTVGSASLLYRGYTNQAPINDECSAATSSVNGAQNLAFAGDTSFATQDALFVGKECGGVSMDGAEVWYKFDTLNFNHATISICPSSFDRNILPFDSKIFLFHFPPTNTCDPIIDCIGNDDSQDLNCGFPGAQIYTMLIRNTEYHVAVGGYSASRGAFTLTVSLEVFPAENDDCTDAIVLDFSSSNPLVVEGDATDATLDHTSECVAAPNGNVWYQFTTPNAPFNMASITTCDLTSNPVQIVVYLGDEICSAVSGSLLCLTSSTLCVSEDPLGASVQFPITPSTLYLVAFHAFPALTSAQFTFMAELYVGPSLSPSMSESSTKSATPSFSSTPCPCPCPSPCPSPSSSPSFSASRSFNSSPSASPSSQTNSASFSQSASASFNSFPATTSNSPTPSSFSPSPTINAMSTTPSSSFSFVPLPPSSTPSFDVGQATILPPEKSLSQDPSRSSTPSGIPLNQFDSPSNSPMPVVVADPNSAGSNSNPILISQGVTQAVEVQEAERDIFINGYDGNSYQINLPEEGLLYVTMKEPPTSDQFNSLVIQLDLFDLEGNELVSFNSDAEICFSVKKDEARSNQCLGYYDEDKNRWLCEDPCLKENNGLLCGKSNHFTNFAILLGGNLGEGCDDGVDKLDEVISWLSLAVICLAIIIVALSVVIIEAHTRKRVAAREAKMRSGKQSGEGTKKSAREVRSNLLANN